MSKENCNNCGRSPEEYEGELTHCPFCDSTKCPKCDMGDDVTCAACANEDEDD